MRICLKCGTKIEASDDICPECGADTTKIRKILSKMHETYAEPSAIEQFILQVGGALSLLQAFAAFVAAIILVWQGRFLLGLIVAPLTLLYSLALYAVFRRVYEQR